jgi:hypothetical protein
MRAGKNAKVSALSSYTSRMQWERSRSEAMRVRVGRLDPHPALCADLSHCVGEVYDGAA